MKFEVGKKYVSHPATAPVTCIGFNSQGKPVLERDGEPHHFFKPNMSMDWVEYKEPKRGTVWVNVYQGYSEAFHTRAYADNNVARCPRLACIEVPWVEGQGLG